MDLSEILEIAISNGRDLASNIATNKFGSENPADRKIERRWMQTSAADLVGVSRQTIAKAEEDGRLPPPDKEANSRGIPRRMGYTIDQIDYMRDVFKTRPGRSEEDDAQVISICGHKGGSWKTGTCVHFAQWLAMKGYKTLIIDMDPQATASLYHGYVADHNVFKDDTALPFLLGETDDLSHCIKPTAWPGLEIIPSCLEMHQLETDLLKRDQANELEHPPHLMLRAGIDTIMDQYDIILIDGSPNIGQGTVNMVCAADIILAPTPAELNDYLSTAQFFEALRDIMAHIDLGGFEPDLRVLVTKYSHITGSSSQWMTKQIRETWGAMVLNNFLSNTEEIGKSQVRMRTIYEQAAAERSSNAAWNKAVSIYDPVFSEITNDVIRPRWASMEASA